MPMLMPSVLLAENVVSVAVAVTLFAPVLATVAVPVGVAVDL